MAQLTPEVGKRYLRTRAPINFDTNATLLNDCKGEIFKVLEVDRNGVWCLIVSRSVRLYVTREQFDSRFFRKKRW